MLVLLLDYLSWVLRHESVGFDCLLDSYGSEAVLYLVCWLSAKDSVFSNSFWCCGCGFDIGWELTCGSIFVWLLLCSCLVACGLVGLLPFGFGAGCSLLSRLQTGWVKHSLWVKDNCGSALTQVGFVVAMFFSELFGSRTVSGCSAIAAISQQFKKITLLWDAMLGVLSTLLWLLRDSISLSRVLVGVKMVAGKDNLYMNGDLVVWCLFQNSHATLFILMDCCTTNMMVLLCLFWIVCFQKGLRTVKYIPSKCRLGFSRVLKGALKVICKPNDFSCWVSLLVLPLCLLKTFCPRSNLECKSANKRQRHEECITNAICSWGVPGGSFQMVRETLAESTSPMLDLDEEDLDLCEQNLKQCKRKICDGHYTAAVRVLLSSGVALYNDATLQELKAKHPFKSAPSLPDIPIDHQHLIESQEVVLDKIKSFPRCGGIRPITVGTIWRRLVSKVSATMIGHSLDGYLDGLHFGVGVPGGGEAIIHAVDRLVEDRGDEVGLSMLLVDFQNAFDLVDRTAMLQEVRLRCPAISRWVEFCYSSPVRLYYEEHSSWSCQGSWYLDYGTIVGDTLVVGKVLELITEDGPRCGLHLNVNKTELFWPTDDPRSRLEGVFPPNISRPLHGVKLLGGPISMDAGFSSALVMKRVSKTIELLNAVAKINDPQCELLLIRVCAGVSKLYFAMRTCPHSVFESAKLFFDIAIRSALERIGTDSELGFGDWKWRLATLPFAFRGLGIYSTSDVLNYAFIASRLQSDTLQTKLLRQTMNGKTYSSVLCYRLGVPLFSASKPCSACSRIFVGDIYEDHVVSCVGIIRIKHRHNVVRDTLVDIYFRSGISAGKKVDVGLDGGSDQKLRPADMLLYSWDRGVDVCVDLTRSSPLTQTGMTDFAAGWAVTEAAHRKRNKYMAKCAAIGCGFLLFSFSSLGELEADAVTLMKRIQKFSMDQDIGAQHRASVEAYKKVHNETVRSGLRMAIVKQSMEMDMWEIKEKLAERQEQMAIRAYEEDRRREKLNQKIEEWNRREEWKRREEWNQKIKEDKRRKE
nr:hypothetical protein [Tanacetum cinerariifolium]